MSESMAVSTRGERLEPAEGWDPRRVKVGIAPIGWTNDDWPGLGGEIPFEQCVREMAEAGYSGCEVGGKFPRDPGVLRAALEPLGLEIASAWISLYFTEPERDRETVEAFATHASFLAAMGAKVAVVCECGHSVQQGPLPVDAARPRFGEDDWRFLVDGLHRIGESARRAGLTIVYHHHMGTGVQTAEEIDRLMQATDPGLVSLLVDPGHLTFSGDDPIALLRRYASRVRHIHLKDVRSEVLERVRREQASFETAVRAGVFTVPGDGSVDMRGFLEAAREIGYSGWMVVEAEQDPAKAPPLDYAKKGRAFVREVTGL
jgi:inosose dehydratase